MNECFADPFPTTFFGHGYIFEKHLLTHRKEDDEASQFVLFSD
ncbi:hypothetical protein AK973_2937 [Pseudomonas brassicacearum]|nr:hypothetical protein AK973_2937 [Pseudomonas brassicacearum]